MQEIWKDIPNYEGRYQVSDTGKVRSLIGIYRGRILKPYVRRCYESVCLIDKDGNRKTALVHRLVALAFIPNPNNYNEVNHKDENKLNNTVENLEWCTRDYNMAYGNARLKQGISYGKPIEQLTVNGFPIAKYCSAEVASKLTGIDSSSIHKCCNGKRSYAGGYIWRFITEF